MGEIEGEKTSMLGFLFEGHDFSTLFAELTEDQKLKVQRKLFKNVVEESGYDKDSSDDMNFQFGTWENRQLDKDNNGTKRAYKTKHNRDD